MRKQEKIKNSIITNLTYCRLKANLSTLEMEIAGNQPVPEKEETGVIKILWGKVKTKLKNEVGKKTVEELEKERAAAESELARFESVHAPKEYALSSTPEKLKKLIAKLFKKDKYGLNKTQFALALILDGEYSFQRPEASLLIVSELLFSDAEYMQGLYDGLCENFKYLRGEGLPTVDELLSLLPSFGNISLQSFINRSKQRKYQANVRKLSADQIGTVLAAKLTLTKKAKTAMPQEEWETFADETLKYIENVRADGDCNLVFGFKSLDEVKEIFSLCELTVLRLAEIVQA